MVVGGWVGGVCTVIFVSNPTVVLRLRLGWGFDNRKQVTDSNHMIETIKCKQCHLNTLPTAKTSVYLVVVYTEFVFYRIKIGPKIAKMHELATRISIYLNI